MHIHKEVSESRPKGNLQGRCVSCGKPISGQGRTVEVVIQESHKRFFTRHLALHKACLPPKEGTALEEKEGFLVVKQENDQ